VAKPGAPDLKLLREAADAMRLSARGYTRVLRVARTLADLDGAASVSRCISPRRSGTVRLSRRRRWREARAHACPSAACHD